MIWIDFIRFHRFSHIHFQHFCWKSINLSFFEFSSEQNNKQNPDLFSIVCFFGCVFELQQKQIYRHLKRFEYIWFFFAKLSVEKPPKKNHRRWHTVESIRNEKITYRHSMIIIIMMIYHMLKWCLFVCIPKMSLFWNTIVFCVREKKKIRINCFVLFCTVSGIMIFCLFFTREKKRINWDLGLFFRFVFLNWS